MNRSHLALLPAIALMLPGASRWAQAQESFGPELEGFSYPWPIQDFAFVSQGDALTMRFMDVPAEHPTGKVAVLLHGKNFCAATWDNQIKALNARGYRVIAPDQIGFCKSTKPEHYQYSFQQLAANTHALLASLGIASATIIGHSTGGMLAARYALMYPKEVSALALVNPIGLEDWKALGVPALTVDQWNERELKNDADRIRAYEKSTYYAGQWKPEYERWVQMLAGLTQGTGREIVARNTALIDDMIYTQPVVYEFPLIKIPTLLLIGDKDTTAIGKDLAPPEIRARLGNYPELAQKTKAAIPGAELREFPDSGHAPQIQEPEKFDETLLSGLEQITH